MALPMRLLSTWRSRSGSPSTRSGTPGSTLTMSSGFFAAACTAISMPRSSTHVAHAHVDAVDFELAGLDLRVIQDVVDDPEQRCRAGADRFRELRAARTASACRAAARSCRSRHSAACGLSSLMLARKFALRPDRGRFGILRRRCALLRPRAAGVTSCRAPESSGRRHRLLVSAAPIHAHRQLAAGLRDEGDGSVVRRCRSLERRAGSRFRRARARRRDIDAYIDNRGND